MIMNVIVWLLFGAIVGWVASLIMNTDEEQGAVANIVIGIIGAFIGGAVGRMMGGPGVTGFNVGSVLLAVLGSVILIFFIRMLSGRRGNTADRL